MASEGVQVQAAPSQRLPSGWQWPALVVALLMLPIGFGGWLWYAAVGDPALAVERDYYRKALDWDRQQGNQRRLRWQVHAERLPTGGGPWSITLSEADGRPLVGATVTGSVVRLGGRDPAQPVQLTEVTAGVYATAVAPRLPGRHAVRVRMARAGAAGTDELEWNGHVEATPQSAAEAR
jgi:hypothetical protein